MAEACDVGLVGLAVMGQNLSLNISSKGFKIGVYNRTYERTEETVKRAEEEKLCIYGYKTLEELIQNLKKPKKIILLIKAGPAVDENINNILKYFEKGDIIIDGGNEWYLNSERRIKLCSEKNVEYLAMGVSGGEAGARYGCSFMPGGSKYAYDCIKDILEKCSAKVGTSPCVTYIGPGSSGNYVKMVHNGIEYGDMQLISESYFIMKHILKYDNKKLSQVFKKWNEGILNSYLIEITANILDKTDELTGDNNYIVDMILDIAGAKGTGKWTMLEAIERGIPCPTICAALDARNISTFKQLRTKADEHFATTMKMNCTTEKLENLENDLLNALYCCKIISYTQGLFLLKQVSQEMKWNLNLGEISRIWRGGCIIRAVFLDRITNAYKNDEKLELLFMANEFSDEMKNKLPSLRKIVNLATQCDIPIPAFSASLAYFQMVTSKNLPLNLVQAQRDYFGSHTYQRTDREGSFHTLWD
ncbi:6-phosphogluconate dehydrogenase, decarboxylating, putative [Plasmodium ovale wallikeri]|uniref:6-phosphogluconate dehydrogenase, decarboxylating n=2 Tax=Plasmodium ovale TaxID=36330 RepID=A0A1A8ZHE1_PLAOA|nr:6-phosphogluconate dehydrogenase, decarboxylating, putative [Plasmodium ovale wallikeri]SBT43242.1 6-phosphogluconate dehydrogenase, decarboxylating, putative [Plasmodium ovale wallikeri]SBT78389.1 6-phosphogluconate dehydrogenase, decarboxylating, putative [Plasmodium ovale]